MFNTNADQSVYDEDDDLDYFGYEGGDPSDDELEIWRNKISSLYEPTSAGGLGWDQSEEEPYSYSSTGLYEGNFVS